MYNPIILKHHFFSWRIPISFVPPSSDQDWIAHYWFRGATPEELLEDSPQQFQDHREMGAVC